jgi:hypothetical protein
MKSFAVITPTIGSEHLRQNILSLRGQDCIHYIVVDGREHWEKVNRLLLGPGGVGLTQQEKFISLDVNIGKGWYGHRVYSAASFLVNEEVLCYLDEDNSVEPDYIESFQRVFLDPKYQWAYTLRTVIDSTGKVIGQDNCESLGHWPVSFSGGTRYHIDTGCFAIPRELAVKVGHYWYGQWGADRQFFAAVKAYAPEFGCTTRHTLNYRLGSETSLATSEMFLHGNKLSEQAYIGERNYPWHEQRSPIVQQASQWTYRTT